ncbi:cell adhesion molecule 1 [Nilaparvata lugens]|uniref:cell adhesion molecule 1 n=1 Tax=Nilaparvata lugens TaxID=108931 RepID=UPI000B98FB00|nr:cell adhesion molecule 1 [Nilaparvata lugens]XP_039293048.1 cell adhesion molecule 1 [Nilaparvata lugens]XP_039293049.1 cell adhesion molecule 1 [Nilaparvata lugens]XP_039293050.1 cell adhesion molecule 1 [Nilaparvata lugens]
MQKIEVFLLFLKLLTAAILIPQGCLCLKLLRVGVPQYKLRGELAVLECHYELEGDSLYAVKWYKENEEFYRYVPKSNPPQSSYRVDGIKVDHQLSDYKQVALRSVNLKSSGVYRCEVSAEAPSFASAQSEGRMEVLFLPTSGPLITGEEKQYQIGDEINLNCTSGKSFPASVLHWFINDQKVSNSRNLIHHKELVHQHGLVTSSLGLRLPVTTDHFRNGSMRVRCVASLSPVLWQGDKESVVQRSPLPVYENREALLLVRASGSSFVPSANFIWPLMTSLLLLRT